MATVESEPKPGRTIRIMMEEYHFLNEFMEMMKQKIELDMKHTTLLKDLKQSWNPKWQDSAIWPLISPMLTYLSKEIENRMETEGELLDLFSKIPETRSPNEHSEDKFDPLELPGVLEHSYTRYQASHQNITTVESLAALKGWYNNLPKKVEIGDVEAKRFILPNMDREYRQAVTAHQQNMSKALKWYSGGIVAALEEHQQRAENVKSLIHDLLRGLNKMTSDLSVVCSAATSDNHSFASSTYIAPRHQEIEQEMGHDLLQTVQYRNYMTDGRIAWPLGGLAVLDSVKVLRGMAEHVEDIHFGGKSDIASGFNFEQINPANRGLPEDTDGPLPREGLSFLSDFEFLRHRNCFLYVCMSMPPLIPLERRHVEQYRNGIPRAKIHLVLDLIAPGIRLEVLWLMRHFLSYLPNHKHVSILFSQRDDASQIFSDIWRKWNFELDYPLPLEVERNAWGIVFLKKTGMRITGPVWADVR